jgi:hypothetical protein
LISNACGQIASGQIYTVWLNLMKQQKRVLHSRETIFCLELQGAQYEVRNNSGRCLLRAGVRMARLSRRPPSCSPSQQTGIPAKLIPSIWSSRNWPFRWTYCESTE